MNQAGKARDRSPVAAAPMKAGHVDYPDATRQGGRAAAGGPAALREQRFMVSFDLLAHALWGLEPA